MPDISPALLLKTRPGDRSDTGISLGGWPRLPEVLSWPRTAAGVPLTHLAEIDLARMPRSLHVEGHDLPLPDCPTEGVVFVFGACGDDDFWQMASGMIQVLYHPAPVAGLPEVPPPEGTLPLGEAATVSQRLWMDISWARAPRIAVSFPALTHYPRVAVEAVPFLSAPTGNPLAENVERAAHGPSPKLTAAALSRAVQSSGLTAIVGADPGKWYLNLTVPWLPRCATAEAHNLKMDHKRVAHGRAEGWSEDRLTIADRHPLPDSFPWSWLMLGRTAQALWSRVANARRHGDRLTKHRRQIEGRRRDWQIAPLVDQFADVPAVAHAWVREAAEQDPHAPVPANRAQAFRDWLGLLDARVPPQDGTGTPVSPGALDRFLGRLGLTDGGANATEDPHTLSADYCDTEASVILLGALNTAIRVGFEEAWPYLLAQGDLSAVPDAFASMVAPLTATGNKGLSQVNQMFGGGYAVQDAPDRNCGDVLLLQLASDTGTHMMWGDIGNLQLWIAPEDLRAGRFDRVHGTADSH